MIISIAENVWCIDCPQKFLGVHVGARTTIIKLSEGLVIHSPGPIDDSDWTEIKNIGTVKWIVAPNNFHHLYLEGAMQQFPEAYLIIAPGLKKKRNELDYSSVLPEVPFSAELRPFLVRGSAMQETVFYHELSKSLICTDLIHEIGPSHHWTVKLYSRIMGFYNKPGVSRLIRFFAYKNKKSARQSLSEIMSLDIRKVIPAHGNIFENNPSKKIEAAYSWLF